MSPIHEFSYAEPTQRKVPALPPVVAVVLAIGLALAGAGGTVLIRAWFHTGEMVSTQRAHYATSLIELGVLLASALVLAAIAWWLVLRLQESQRQLHVMAIHDPLTGVYNRRYFREVYAAELERARRTGAPFSVAMLDVDNFKSLNDTHGHRVGDEVLAAFADLLRSSIRSVDVLARYGGDEFVIFMPSTAGDNAATALQRVERNVERWKRMVPEGIGVSIGVSTWEPDTEPLEDADRRMYQAKRARHILASIRTD